MSKYKELISQQQTAEIKPEAVPVIKITKQPNTKTFSIRLDPELYSRLKQHLRSRGLYEIGPYIRALIVKDLTAPE